MESKQKLFAFKLAAKQQKKDQPDELKWKARDGVAVAGCTEYRFPNNYRYASASGSDNGVYC